MAWNPFSSDAKALDASNRCDLCSRKLGEDETHELILCGICDQQNLKPKQYHCVVCGASVKWLNKLNKIKAFMKKKHTKFVPIGLSILVFLGGLFALEVFSYRTFLCVVAGIVAIPVVLFALLGAFILLTKVIYEIGSYVWCKKFGFDVEEANGHTLGMARWALGMLTLTIFPIVYFAGRLALFIIDK